MSLRAHTVGGLLCATMLAATVSIAHAEKFKLSDAQRQKVLAKLVDLGASYADVPSATTCRKPHSECERLICANYDLQLMELLHVRSAVYAEENATGREVAHATYFAALPETCRDEQCVVKFYKEAAEVTLGGESPYAAEEGK